MKTTLLKTIGIGTIFSVLTLSVNADVVDTIEKSFDVNANSELSLDNVNGKVEIISWSKQQVQVNATIKADSQEERERITIEMQQKGKEIKVKTRYKDKSFFDKNNSNSGQVTYQIMVPSDINLSSIDLVNGSLIIEDVHGDIDVELVNGSVKATGLMSDSEISSVNGSIKVVYQALASNFKDIDIETVNGSIKLTLPSDLNASIEAETSHGSIKNDFGLQNKKSFTGNKLKGKVGTGQAEVSLESVNGSIKIKSL
mgnify:CR=1 FL=1